jgi:hypothetical protein
VSEPRNGPPKEDGAPPQSPTAISNNNRPQSNASRRQCGRDADVWRDGFGYGFRDALRCAARRVEDPAVLATLSELAEQYELASDG